MGPNDETATADIDDHRVGRRREIAELRSDGSRVGMREGDGCPGDGRQTIGEGRISLSDIIQVVERCGVIEEEIARLARSAQIAGQLKVDGDRVCPDGSPANANPHRQQCAASFFQ